MITKQKDYMHSVRIAYENWVVRLSGDTLPSYVDSYCRIRNHTFVSDSGCTVALLNPTNEPLENVRIAIKTSSTTAVCYGVDGSAYQMVRTADSNSTYGFFAAAHIGAYEMVVIETL